MRILRVFPHRTSYTPIDELAFVGWPPLEPFRPAADEVHVSVTFSWEVEKGRQLAAAWADYYPFVAIGGPAMAPYPGDAFKAGLYIRQGVTFTSRGCNNNCPWCLVPDREGKLRELPRIAPGHIINDNNFLQCSREHRRRVYAMLAERRQRATFAGGLQASLVTDEIAAEFRDIRIEDIFLAADTAAALGPLERAVSRLQFLGRDRLRCYVLIGFDRETIEQADKRLRAVWEVGAMPFAMLYQPPTNERKAWPGEWRALQKTWTRPAAMKAEMKGIERDGRGDEGYRGMDNATGRGMDRRDVAPSWNRDG